jgi:arginine decarboxylase
VLVIPVIDAIGPARRPLELPPLEGEVHALVGDMQELEREVSVKTYRDVYNEAVSNKETMHSLFDLGYLTLLERAHFEQLFGRVMTRIAKVVEGLDYVPEELEALPKRLADQYVCNFSLFQGMPDHWAIGQLFPIVPLTRLNELPERNATLVDISCDSDGKIDRFIDLRDVKSTLPVHELRRGESYYLGAFLTGAYQEILGDLHNLFGDTNAVHVRLTDKGYEITDLVHGDTITEVLNYVQFNAQDLIATFRRKVQNANDRISRSEANAFIADYIAGLAGYTYLEG